ncbi:cupin domain-containing protein [Stappia sp. ES.058]|uniref:cupin domain-containing protein n=1 Tax=Stappia sp. ES.058 TaxID=1881061 RepID=UPI000B862404|nr:cupin domain-containing protein [Stappia sp. ES.058]
MLNTEDFSKDVGLRLRAIRQSHGLSQRELAKRAGVTNGFISQLEAAKINTSLSALKRVLDGIPIGLSQFFAYEPQREEQVFFASNELTEIGKGRISYRQVGGSLFAHDLQMLHEVYEPGADTGRVMLSHKGEEAGIVIEGRLEVTVGEQKKVLGPGDAYLFTSSTPHRFRALRNQRCVVVSACTPPSF